MRFLGIPLLALVFTFSFSPYSAFAANQLSEAVNIYEGETGFIKGQHKYGRATLTLQSGGPSNARKYARVMEYCEYEPVQIGTLTVTSSNPIASNNYYMSGSCYYFMDTHPNGTSTLNNVTLRIQNYN